MKRLALVVALMAGGPAAIAQPIYRCGNAYAEQACGNGDELVLRDDRAEAQREEALGAQRRHQDMADALARDRREFEAQPPGVAGIHGRGEAREDEVVEPSEPPKRSSKRNPRRKAAKPVELKRSSAGLR